MLVAVFLIGLVIIGVLYVNRYSIGFDETTMLASFVVLGAVILLLGSAMLLSRNLGVVI